MKSKGHHLIAGKIGGHPFFGERKGVAGKCLDTQVARQLVPVNLGGRAIVIIFILMTLIQGCASAPKRNLLPGNIIGGTISLNVVTSLKRSRTR